MPLDPGLAAYLQTNRDFLISVVDQAIASLGIGHGARVLDAGTGAGGALAPLVRAAGTAGSVLAVDLNPAVLALAGNYAEQLGLAGRVSFQCGDLADVLAEAARSPERAFDAIWASDVVWPGNFAEPADIVALMARALRPGGVLALFTSNYYQSTFLPGHSRLERTLRTASELRWGLPDDGPRHPERRLAWLHAAGLADIAFAVFPRVGLATDDDPAVRAYLEATVWPELSESATARGIDAGLTQHELDHALHILSPGHPRYVMDEPGYFVLHPTILATGTRR